MKWVLILAGIVLALIVITGVIGSLLPREHSATRAAQYREQAPAIYGVLVDLTKEAGSRYAIMIDQPPTRLVVTIVDDKLPYGGTWIYDLSPSASGTGTLVRITENGFVKNVIFRCLSRYVFGYASTMEARLKELGTKFGEPVVIRP